MTAVKDQAVCIRWHKYSESSQIVTLFTQGHGKIRALAKGSRKPKSTFNASLDLLTRGDTIFHPARGDRSLALLTEFHLIDNFGEIRKKLLRLNIAQFAFEMLDAFTEEADPHENLYFALVHSLNQLQQVPSPLNVLIEFQLALLREVGLMPTWTSCSVCGAELPCDSRLYFSSGQGGMLCRDCEPAIIEKRFVEPPVLKCLQSPQTLIHTPFEVVLQAHDLLGYHYREITGRQSKLMNFVNQLIQQQKDLPRA